LRLRELITQLIRQEEGDEEEGDEEEVEAEVEVKTSSNYS
jgi:hypothetical protein